MTPTDVTERGLEALIVADLTGTRGAVAGSDGVHEVAPPYDGGGYVEGDPHDYDRAKAVDLVELVGFLQATQPAIVETFDLERDGTSRDRFLVRVQGEIAKRGIVDVLRKGVRHQHASVELFYGTPTPGNPLAAVQYRANIFSVTRQLRYSQDETKLALDLVLFINGLPVATFELKNSFTKQTVEDAVKQYERDRDPKELLFALGRCAVHFAVDDSEVRMCTHLQGRASWFLPFNKGMNDGAGNPPNPDGLKTAYLWQEILRPDSLTDIIEHYAQLIEERTDGGKKRKRQIFPRYHQLDVVRRLLADAGARGPGHRYLIQHSAGSGKSNSIAWLAHQLVALGEAGQPTFDSIIVVTDRKVLDQQIRETIKQFMSVGATVGEARRSDNLREFLQSGKKIIITTVQKFPMILEEIGDEHRARRFAIIIDEAHSSQGGRTSAQMNAALSPETAVADDESIEDLINQQMERRRMLPNASYFAFTATPKNKTLEMFGARQPGGMGEHRPFHAYTMKQAIEEGFILDVLRNYTPIDSYYRLIKTVADDPEFDTARARAKLRLYVESHGHAIGQKAATMLDHFETKIAGPRKLGGEARAMVVTDGIERAIQYFHAFTEQLRERRSPYRPIVAFSGEYDFGGQLVTEAGLNGFASAAIPERFREEPYRFLIVADKFQTGYDEPLLHTMYVDKTLSGIKAVQTLSRLNRAHPKKSDTFVLDFRNDSDMIEAAFSDYYRTTILSGETDPNKLHDLQAELDAAGIYSQEEVEALVARFLGGADRDELDPIVDVAAARYRSDLDEEGQVAFKGNAKAFTRTYTFLATILPFANAEWEKLATYLTFLVPKLPAPVEEDLAPGIFGAIDMDSYRLETRAAIAIALGDEDAVIEPVPTGSGGSAPDPEFDYLSNIVKTFNIEFGDKDWNDLDRVRQVITEDLPPRVAADPAYQNALKNSDAANARIEHDDALVRVMGSLLNDHAQLFKAFQDDPSFKKQLSDFLFAITSRPGPQDGQPTPNKGRPGDATYHTGP